MMGKCLPIAFAAVFLTGCSMFTPYNGGVVMGEAVYLGYSRVADRQDVVFRQNVADLWDEVNKLESISDLVNSMDRLLLSFDNVLASDRLSPADRAVLVSLRQSVVSRVEAVLASRIQSNQDAVDFLSGLRDGVNNMIAIEQAANETK